MQDEDSDSFLRLFPLIPLAISLLLNTFRLLPFPAKLNTQLRKILTPFRDFLQPEDLVDPIDSPRPEPHFQRRALLFFAGVQLALWIGYLGYNTYLSLASSLFHSLATSLAWAYILLALVLKPPITPPYLFLIFASTQAIISALDILVYYINSHNIRGHIPSFLNVLFSAAFTYIGGTLHIDPIRPAKYVAKTTDVPSNSLSCPEDDVNLWEWLTFSFVRPILTRAMQGTLNEEDVWTLSPYFRHENLFNKYLEYRHTYPDHTLFRFLLASNSLDLSLDLTLEIWKACADFVPPYALKEILAALASPEIQVRRTAYYWALVTFISHLLFAQKDLFTGWHIRRCYERTRGQLFCALHYKALKRQSFAEETQDEKDAPASLGKITTLMSTDAYAVAQRFWEFSGLFTSPIRLVIALCFLYQILGWSALVGVLVVFIAYALNYPLAKFNLYITRNARNALDKRQSVVDELLQNIRFLKISGWDNHWFLKAWKAREEELRWRIRSNIIGVVISFIWTWIPSATTLLAFLLYTLVAGEDLTVSKAFTAISLFAQVQGPLTSMPQQFFALLDAYISMQRLEEFLDEPEVPDWSSGLSPRPIEPNPHNGQLGFEGAVFRWQSLPRTTDTPSRFQLGPLNVVFPKGKLTLIGGPTGAGKSALLSAFLGEMYCLEGKVMIDKSHNQIAYAGQKPWLEHATIRENIVFKSKHGFDEGRYEAVLDACALRKDLEILAAGDSTEIGEKGITLSGGQRARIALARALYSPAECILLDDPLAAVDMHTAQHIVKNCLKGKLLRGRTVILVTHHIGLCLPAAAKYVGIVDGRVVQQLEKSEFHKLDVARATAAASQGNSNTMHSPIQSPVLSLNELRSVDGSGSAVTLTGAGAGAAVTVPGDDPAASAAGRRRRIGKLIENEARAEGRVTMKTYMSYIRAAGYVPWVLTTMLMLSIWSITVLLQVFIAAWGEAYRKGDRDGELSWTAWIAHIHYPWDNLPPPDQDVKPWLFMYMVISLMHGSMILINISVGYYASLQASRAIFNSLLRRISRAPTRFFDTTPIGRILNRFTTDIGVIDGPLHNSARTAVNGVMGFVVSFLAMLAIIPSFAPFAVCIALLYIRLAPAYINASRDLRRLESVSLSPAFAGFDELLHGIVHIRAFGLEMMYQKGFYSKVDKFQAYDHHYWLVSGWLRWRYDCLGSIVVFVATLFALFADVGDGSAAIVIVQASMFAEASRQLVRVAAQVELDFNSVERINEYRDIDQEAPATIEGKRPPAYWPSNMGPIVFDGLQIRYAPELPPVLHGLSFVIEPGEHVGVVGRTGSGKSTLAQSLLRTVEASNGGIHIDGIDISTIGLEDLRSRITMISQDVSIFEATVRGNLDPFNQHTDAECIDVLDRCHLSPLLQRRADENGKNNLLEVVIEHGLLSSGEGQLIALARAILRKTNIVIMDEATSQIDGVLDEHIQNTIREEFANSIVITIAHRLRTIVGYDRVLVLDNGNIIEFDTPRGLLNANGAFRRLCEKSTDWEQLSTLLDT